MYLFTGLGRSVSGMYFRQSHPDTSSAQSPRVLARAVASGHRTRRDDPVMIWPKVYQTRPASRKRSTIYSTARVDQWIGITVDLSTTIPASLARDEATAALAMIGAQHQDSEAVSSGFARGRTLPN